MTAEQSFFDDYNPKIEVLENWSDLKEASSLEEVSCQNFQQSSSFASTLTLRDWWEQGKGGAVSYDSIVLTFLFFLLVLS